MRPALVSGAGLGPVPGDSRTVEAGTRAGGVLLPPLGHLTRGSRLPSTCSGKAPSRPLRYGCSTSSPTASDARRLGCCWSGAWALATLDYQGQRRAQRSSCSIPGLVGAMPRRWFSAGGRAASAYVWRLLEARPGPAAGGASRSPEAATDGPDLARRCLFPVLLLLIFLRVPIGLSMLSSAWSVVAGLRQRRAAANQMKTLAYGQFSSHSLSIVPLFLLMGQFATLGGMSQVAVQGGRGLLGHPRGWRGDGRGRRLRRVRRDLRLVARHRGDDGPGGAARTASAPATRAAWRPARWPPAGRSGILIPPSIVLVIYAILAEQNIAKLFAAAFIPGILAALGYMSSINIVVRLNPKLAGSMRADALARALAGAGRGLAGAADLRRRRRRHLQRAVHADRRRGGRRRGHRRAGLVARRADAAQAASTPSRPPPAARRWCS